MVETRLRNSQSFWTQIQTTYNANKTQKPKTTPGDKLDYFTCCQNLIFQPNSKNRIRDNVKH